MRGNRTWWLAAICGVGLEACFTGSTDLGFHNQAGAGNPSPANVGSGGVTGTGTTATGGQEAMGGSGAETGGSSGTGGEGPCFNVVPCGGDVVGTWTVTSSCLGVSGAVDLSALGLACASAPVTGSLEVTGTWIAHLNGTYSDQTITSGDEQLDVPAACLSISGTQINCDMMAQTLEYPGHSSATCTPAPSGGCTCQLHLEQTGGMGVRSYCVSGNRLTITPTLSQAGTLTGTIELAK